MVTALKACAILVAAVAVTVTMAFAAFCVAVAANRREARRLESRNAPKKTKED